MRSPAFFLHHTMSLKRDAEDTVVENGHSDGNKKQKTDSEEWVIPEKFKQVKEELNCLPWSSDVTVQDLITETIGKANTDAFFVAGMCVHSPHKYNKLLSSLNSTLTLTLLSDLGAIVHRFQKWKSALPDVQPYYGMHELEYH